MASTGWYDEESTGRSNDHRYFSNTVAKAFQLFAEPLRFVVVEIDFSNLPLRVFKGGHPADHPPVVYKQSPGVELSSVWIIALEFEVQELNSTHYSDYSQCASRSRMNRFLVSIDWEIYLWWIRVKCHWKSDLRSRVQSLKITVYDGSFSLPLAVGELSELNPECKWVIAE